MLASYCNPVGIDNVVATSTSCKTALSRMLWAMLKMASEAFGCWSAGKSRRSLTSLSF